MVSDEVVVSICCITYNHAPYIRQCLEGFMMQQTDFPIEVLIHDDASTDGTTEIIKEYEAKYPDIIKPIYEEENQWVKGRRGSAVFNFPRAKGKYIAMCEGDDYWTDPLKLQKQVDVLDKYDDVSIVFNRVEAISKDSMPLGWGIPNIKAKLYEKVSIKDYIEEEFYRGRWTFHTSSIMFRRDIQGLQLAMANEYKLFPHADMVLMLFYLNKGYGFYIQDCCGCYRVFSGGYNSDLIKDREYKMLESQRKIAALLSLNEQTNGKYSKFIKRGILRQKYDLDVFLKGKLVILKPKYLSILIMRLIQI